VTLQPYGADRAANLWLDESDGLWYPPEAHPDYHPPEPWIGVTSPQTCSSRLGQGLGRRLWPWRQRSALAPQSAFARQEQAVTTIVPAQMVCDLGS
jgi:hypothetical protein